MSASLVRKSLELFEDDLVESSGSKSKKKKNKDPMKLISTNKRGVKKELRHLQHKNYMKNKVTVQSKNLKAAITDESQKHQSYDKTEDNLYYIQQIDRAKPYSGVVEKIITYNKGKLSRNRDMQKETTYEETVFTDRDFDRFEEEY